MPFGRAGDINDVFLFIIVEYVDEEDEKRYRDKRFDLQVSSQGDF